MKVDIWSDVVCPWCYIGKRRFEQAVAQAGVDVEVRWHAFELDPRAPQRIEGSLRELLAKKYNTSVERMAAMQEHVRETGAAEGIAFDFDRAVTGNTFAAHRLILYAQEQGLGGQLKERLMRAYFTDGVAISDVDTLVGLAKELGVVTPEAAFEDETWAARVRGDEDIARRSGITGVPFFVVDETYAVSGAQPTKVFVDLLNHLNGAAQSASTCDADACDPPG